MRRSGPARRSTEVAWISVCVAATAAAAALATMWAGALLAGVGAVAAGATLTLIARRPRVHWTSAPFGFFAAAVLSFGVPLWFVEATPAPASGSWWGPAALTVAVGGRLAWMAGRGEQRIAEAMVWIFSYVFLGLAPLVQLRMHTDPGTTPNIHHDLDTTTSLAVALGLAAFAVGLTLGGRTQERSDDAAADGLDPGRVLSLATGAILVALYYISAVGPAALFGSRDGLSTRLSITWPNPTTAAIVGGAASMPLVVAFVALVKVRQTSPRRTWRTSLLPAAVLLVLLVAVNPISSPRFVFGTVLLSILTVFGLTATRSRFRAFVLGTVAGLLLLFPIADAFRREHAGRKATDPVSSLLTGDFDAWSQINNSLLYLHDHGSTMGRQALGVVLFWVPRSLWESKPTDTGILLADFRNYNFSNLSAPMWAELLVNGGWVGLVVGMAALGWLIRRWDTRTVAVLRNGIAPGVLACILPFYMLILLRGSLLQATAMLVLILLSNRFVRSARPTGTSDAVQRPPGDALADVRP